MPVARARKVGRDQNLSSVFREPNMPLTQKNRRSARHSRAGRRAAAGPVWISVGSRQRSLTADADTSFPGSAAASRLTRPSSASRELLRNVRDTLERRFPLAWVRGELSNLSRAPSGHCYFTLKDGGAQVDCVMFRAALAALDWEPRERRAGRGARAGLALRAARALPAHRRGDAPGRARVRSTSASCA